jgi:hypothetical protein
VKLMVVINALRMTFKRTDLQRAGNGHSPDSKLATGPPSLLVSLGDCNVGSTPSRWTKANGIRQEALENELWRHDEVLGKERAAYGRQDGTRTALTGGKRTGIQ